uniref:Uncharacterized protein n=1 Tax=Caenorhabditis japonica TaxID=281687 RepID=A0A8R1HTH7_CAEJA
MWLLFLLSIACWTSVASQQYEPFMGSSWSMWSPWSFCSNNVMIRVRACSTVRGYKCIGNNKEFQSCNSPPKRNNFDYEDPEASDREMAMKQLYQDYEPEIPDEVRHPQTRGNRNFHLISPTTRPLLVPQPPTPPASTFLPSDHFSVMNRGGTGVGMESEEFMYDDETTAMRKIPEPKPTNPSETTFDFEKYPKSTLKHTSTVSSTTIVMTTETTTTPTTTTATTTEPTTTTIEEEIVEITEEPTPQTVTPYHSKSVSKIVNHEAFMPPEEVGFHGKYTLEEPLPEVSQPTFAAPPGTTVMEEPTTEDPVLPSSFPIVADSARSVAEEEIVEPESDGSTHSVGSYSIGKEPVWEEEPEPLATVSSTGTFAETETESLPTNSVPRFSISPSTRRLGEVRRAPSTVKTHIEMSMSMLPFIPTTVQDNTATVTAATTEKPTPEPIVVAEHGPSKQYPKIALITSQQNVQHFPKMMNEQRAEVRPRTRIGSVDIEEPTSTTKKPSKVTVEITNKTLKKKRKNRRLKKLNRLGKIRTVAVLPTELTIPEATEPFEKPMPTPAKFELAEDKFLTPKAPRPTWASEKDRRVFEENRELEARIAALRNKVERNRQIIATMQIPDDVKVQPTNSAPNEKKSNEVMLEGDTARALSWMINDMERLVDGANEKASTDVVDRLPVEKVGEEMDEDSSTTTVSPFPFPIPENGFALIRSKRSAKTGTMDKKVLWSSWSEWTECQCGKQSRKRKCLKQLGSKYSYNDHTFIPNEITDTDSMISEVSDNRVKRSVKCLPDQIEERLCYSSRC